MRRRSRNCRRYSTGRGRPMSQCRNVRVENGKSGHHAGTMTAGPGEVAGMAAEVVVAVVPADAGTVVAAVVRCGGRPYNARSA